MDRFFLSPLLLTCCCEHVRNNAAAHIAYMKKLYSRGAGEGGGFLKCATANTGQVFK